MVDPKAVALRPLAAQYEVTGEVENNLYGPDRERDEGGNTSIWALEYGSWGGGGGVGGLWNWHIRLAYLHVQAWVMEETSNQNSGTPPLTLARRASLLVRLNICNSVTSGVTRRGHERRVNRVGDGRKEVMGRILVRMSRRCMSRRCFMLELFDATERDEGEENKGGWHVRCNTSDKKRVHRTKVWSRGVQLSQQV